MKLYLISDNLDSLTGLRFAGIEGCIAKSEKELASALESVLCDKEIGIVLLTEYFSQTYPSIVEEVKSTHRMPLFVDIPNRTGSGRKKDFITSYINEAIGLKL